jgi:hypothetical protein
VVENAVVADRLMVTKYRKRQRNPGGWGTSDPDFRDPLFVNDETEDGAADISLSTPGLILLFDFHTEDDGDARWQTTVHQHQHTREGVDSWPAHDGGRRSINEARQPATPWDFEQRTKQW